MRRRRLIGLRRAEDGEVKGYSNTLGRMPRTHPQQIALDAVFDQGKQLGAVVVQGETTVQRSRRRDTRRQTTSSLAGLVRPTWNSRRR